MSDLASAAQAAETYTVGNTVHTFPLLDLEDIGVICRKIKKARQEEVAKYCTMNGVPVAEKVQAMMAVADVGYLDFCKYVETPDGIKDVLASSLKKAQVPDAQAKEVLASIKPVDKLMLARLVSTSAERVVPQGTDPSERGAGDAST